MRVKRIYFHMITVSSTAHNNSTPQCSKNNHHNAALHNSVSVISIHSFIHRSSLVFMMYEFVIIIQDLILIRCKFFPFGIFFIQFCIGSVLHFPYFLLSYKNIKFMLYFFPVQSFPCSCCKQSSMYFGWIIIKIRQTGINQVKMHDKINLKTTIMCSIK